MTHSIVAGKVVIGRTTKPADYESKKAEIELSFALPENSTDEHANAAIHAVTTLALWHVHGILGLAPQPAGAAPAKPAAAGKKGKTEPAGSTTTTGVKVENAGPAEAAAKLEASLPGAEESSTHLPDDVLGLGDAGDDGLGDLLGAAPQPVTDEELTSAITRKNAEIKNPQAIRGLIGKYVAPPKQARDIPAEVRHKFLEELGGLKAA